MNFNAIIPVLELKITKEEQCSFKYQSLAIHYLSQTSSLPAFPHIVRAPPWSSHSPYLTPGQKHTDPCCSLPVDMSIFLSRLFLLIGKASCSPLIPVSITVSGTLRELGKYLSNQLVCLNRCQLKDTQGKGVSSIELADLFSKEPGSKYLRLRESRGFSCSFSTNQCTRRPPQVTRK